ncbi:MAG: glycosyltransferase family 39 protein [Nitrospirae bacterium]|nr:glycosyltransferase family 39 protein [Nitrospirota bacterium]
MGKDKFAIPALLILCGMLFFFALGTPGLTDRDEATFAEATREMLVSGDWLTPRFNGHLRFDKPILIYYLMAPSMLVWGADAPGARLPAAVFGAALTLLLYGFLRRVHSPRAGFVGATIFATSLMTVLLARAAITDMVLVFFLTAGMFAAFLALSEGKRSWWWGVYVALALAFLAKGPVGLVIPALVLLGFLLWTGQTRRFLREGHPLAGAGLFLLVAAPWFAAMFLLHGEAYLDAASYHTLYRYASVIGGHGGPFWFYLPVLFVGFFPWSGMLPAALWRGWRLPEASGRPPGEIRLFRLCLVWVGVVFLFFSSSSTRLPHYLFPLVPAAAILTALHWDRALSGRMRLTGGLWTAAVLGVAAGGALLALPSFAGPWEASIRKEAPGFELQALGDGYRWLGLVLAAGPLAAALAGLRSLRAAFALLAGTTIAATLLLVTVALPPVDRLFLAPLRAVAAEAGERLNPEDRLVAYGVFRPSLVFYSRHHVVPLQRGEAQAIAPFLAESGRTLLITRSDLLPELVGAGGEMTVLRREGEYLLLMPTPGPIGAPDLCGI